MQFKQSTHIFQSCIHMYVGMYVCICACMYCENLYPCPSPIILFPFLFPSITSFQFYLITINIIFPSVFISTLPLYLPPSLPSLLTLPPCLLILPPCLPSSLPTLPPLAQIQSFIVIEIVKP